VNCSLPAVRVSSEFEGEELFPRRCLQDTCFPVT